MLGTFGAIMSFGMDLEGRGQVFYQGCAELPNELREDLLRRSEKRHRRLEKARREGVVELALEAISGLDAEDYSIELSIGGGLSASLRRAIALEETLKRFYREAGAKLPIQEIARLFLRCAEGNEENLERLRAALNEAEPA